ncbi:hypothetical protein BC628DRAFT_597751 [Trametes gibbosa]|nr:hypothetical protein BC628DRAFT_597751 [Trametes gibbosa]
MEVGRASPVQPSTPDPVLFVARSPLLSVIPLRTSTTSTIFAMTVHISLISVASCTSIYGLALVSFRAHPPSACGFVLIVLPRAGLVRGRCVVCCAYFPGLYVVCFLRHGEIRLSGMRDVGLSRITTSKAVRVCHFCAIWSVVEGAACRIDEGGVISALVSSGPMLK